MKRIFKGSLLTLGAMFLISAILFGIGVASPEDSLLYNTALGGVVIMFCSSPLVMLIAAVTGIATLIVTFSNRDKQKRKNDFSDFTFDDDIQLDDIMDQLSPEQQAYLENRLQERELGVGSDGEIVSLDDLFDDDIFKEKRM